MNNIPPLVRDFPCLIFNLAFQYSFNYLFVVQHSFIGKHHVAQKVNININITEHPITMGTSSISSFALNHVIDQDIDTMKIMTII